MRSPFSSEVFDGSSADKPAQISALINQTAPQLKFGSQSGEERAEEDRLLWLSPYLAPGLNPKWGIFQRNAKELDCDTV